jgi:hypothetical protein
MSSKREERKQRAEEQRAKQEQLALQRKWRSRALIVLAALGLIAMGVMSVRRDGEENEGRVWSKEHGHWHDK